MNDWFNDYDYGEFSNIPWVKKSNSERNYARYWAAEEMAADIYYELPDYDGHYYEQKFYFSGETFRSRLTQILKKEWFR